MKIQYHWDQPSACDSIAKKVLAQKSGNPIWAFKGEVGVGKTRFIQAVCKALKVKESVISPSYTLINTYNTVDNKLIAHMDLYRITKSAELFEIGWDYYLTKADYIFIEWPQVAEAKLPSNTFWLTLSTTKKKGERVLTFIDSSC